MTSLDENYGYRVISNDYIEKTLKMIEADMNLNQDDRACLNRCEVIKFDPNVTDDESFSNHLKTCKSDKDESTNAKNQVKYITLLRVIYE